MLSFYYKYFRNIELETCKKFTFEIQTPSLKNICLVSFIGLNERGKRKIKKLSNDLLDDYEKLFL